MNIIIAVDLTYLGAIILDVKTLRVGRYCVSQTVF